MAHEKTERGRVCTIATCCTCCRSRTVAPLLNLNKKKAELAQAPRRENDPHDQYSNYGLGNKK
jgi:hypothetical protein